MAECQYVGCANAVARTPGGRTTRYCVAHRGGVLRIVDDPMVLPTSTLSVQQGIQEFLETGDITPALNGYLTELGQILKRSKRDDERTYLAAGRELRATLDQLRKNSMERGENEDDPWGFGELRPAMGNASSA